MSDFGSRSDVSFDIISNIISDIGSDYIYVFHEKFPNQETWIKVTCLHLLEIEKFSVSVTMWSLEIMKCLFELHLCLY